MNIRVYYEDTDISGFVYHSNYFNFCERARSELFFSQGLSPVNGDSHFVVSEVNGKFIKSAKFGDLLNVETDVMEIKNFSLKLLQTIYRDDEKVFEATITLAHLKGIKLSKISRETKAIFENL